MTSPIGPSTPPLRRHLLAVLSGALLTLSFSPGSLSSFAAWLALVPLLMGIRNISFWDAFRSGLVAGLAHYLTLLYWIVVVLQHYGNLNITIAVFSLFLLSLYLSLYTGLFSALASRQGDSWPAPFLMACCWVGLEYLKAHLLTGFPWCLIGYSQVEHLPIIQAADLFGVYGVSFLIVFANGVFFRILTRLPLGRAAPVLKWELPVLLLLLAATWGYGHLRIGEIQGQEKGKRPVKVAVVQANIDQAVKWDPAYQEATIKTYFRLTRLTHGFDPDLIVWPETALPFFFQEQSTLSQKVVSLAAQSGAVLVFGSPAYTRHGRTVTYFNRAYVIAPKGREILYYDKNHLVPFGEYVPLKKYLPFIHRLVEAAGDFASGERPRALKAGDLSLGVLICFEAIFPEMARAVVRDGADCLVNLTNDAWFGRTSAPYQHLHMAVFRAIENRRPMIRAANTGFSAVIGPTGAIETRGDLFVEEVLKGSVRREAGSLTFYARFGDIFAKALLIIFIVHAFYGVWARRR